MTSNNAHDDWDVDFVFEESEDMLKGVALGAMQSDLERFVRKHADLTPYKTPPRSDLQRPLTPTQLKEGNHAAVGGGEHIRPLTLDEEKEEMLEEKTLRNLSPLRRDSPPQTPPPQHATSAPSGVVVPTANDDDADARRKRLVDELLAARRRSTGVPALIVVPPAPSALATMPPLQAVIGQQLLRGEAVVTPSFSAVQTRPPSTHLSPIPIDGEDDGPLQHHPDGPLPLFGSGQHRHNYSPQQDLVSSRTISPELSTARSGAVVAVAPPTLRRIVEATTEEATEAPPPAPLQQTPHAAVGSGALVVSSVDDDDDGNTVTMQRFHSRGHLMTPRAPDGVRGNRREMVAQLLKTSNAIQAEGLLSAASEQQQQHVQRWPRPRTTLTPPPEVSVEVPHSSASKPFEQSPLGFPSPQVQNRPSFGNQVFVSPNNVPQYISATTPDVVKSPFAVSELFGGSLAPPPVAVAQRTGGRVSSASPHPQPPSQYAPPHWGSPSAVVASPHQSTPRVLAPLADDSNWNPPRARSPRASMLGPDVRRAAARPEKRFDDTVAPASYAAAELMEQVKQHSHQKHHEQFLVVSSSPAAALPAPPTSLPMRAVASMHNLFPTRPPAAEALHQKQPSTYAVPGVHYDPTKTGGDERQPSPRPTTNQRIRSAPAAAVVELPRPAAARNSAPPPPPPPPPPAFPPPNLSPTYESFTLGAESFTPTNDNSPNRMALRRSRSVTFL